MNHLTPEALRLISRVRYIPEVQCVNRKQFGANYMQHIPFVNVLMP